MYAKLQAAVVTPEGVAEFFSTVTGVRQGCQMCPFLFSFYLNEFVDVCNKQNGQGIYISEIFPNVMLLMYADDMVEGADSIGRLHKLINLLSTYCDDWGLQVNLEKTKIMVFRNGGVFKEKRKLGF